MAAKSESPVSPICSTVAEAAARRADRNPEYRAERERLREFEYIARLVIEFRAKNNLTQQESAKLVGTGHSAISRIESGQHKTSVETLRRIAKTLDVRLGDRFRGRTGREARGELLAI